MTIVLDGWMAGLASWFDSMASAFRKKGRKSKLQSNELIAEKKRASHPFFAKLLQYNQSARL